MNARTKKTIRELVKKTEHAIYKINEDNISDEDVVSCLQVLREGTRLFKILNGFESLPVMPTFLDTFTREDCDRSASEQDPFYCEPMLDVESHIYMLDPCLSSTEIDNQEQPIASNECDDERAKIRESLVSCLKERIRVSEEKKQREEEKEQPEEENRQFLCRKRQKT